MGAVAISGATRLVLGTYNTFVLMAGHVYALATEFCGAYYYHVLNLGPCTLYIAEQDPEVLGERSEIIPPFTSDNLILVPDGPEGLQFLAGPPSLKPPWTPRVCGDEPPPEPPEDALIQYAVVTVRLVRG